MKSAIGVKGLRINCLIGCLERERTQSQEIEIDIRIERQFPQEDDIAQTVDYAQVAELVERVAVNGKFFLLEKLAQAIWHELSKEHSGIQKMAICIKKPKALENAEYCFVELEYELE